MTEREFAAWRRARGKSTSGAEYRDAYWAYRARIGNPVPGSPQAPKPQPPPEPTVTPRPTIVPGTLDARGFEDVADLDRWRTQSAADLDFDSTQLSVDEADAVRRQGTYHNDVLRGVKSSYGSRGLLRSGLRGAAELRAEGANVDSLSRLGRTYGDRRRAIERARTNLTSTYGQRRRGIEDSAVGRLLAEYSAGGALVTPPAPPAAQPAASKPAVPKVKTKGTPPRPRGIAPNPKTRRDVQGKVVR